MIDVIADGVRERQKKNDLRAKKAKMQNKGKILAIANGMLNEHKLEIREASPLRRKTLAITDTCL